MATIDDMRRLAVWMVRALRAHDDDAVLGAIRTEVEDFCSRFPVPGIAS